MKKNLSIHISGTVTPHTTQHIYLATDAATDPTRAASGYLSTTGHYGAHAHPYPATTSGHERTTVTELRAIHRALNAIRNTAETGQPVTILTDSTNALAYLNEWRNGGTRMPEGYITTWRATGKQPTLAKLQQQVASTKNLRWSHVKGHSGHPLNECADSLAKLALRCCRGQIDRDQAKALAPQWAERNLKAVRP